MPRLAGKPTKGPTRREFLIAGGAGAAGLTGLLSNRLRGPRAIDGIVWQPDHATVEPRGRWDTLGARALLVQWSIVDETAFIPGTSAPNTPHLPDWQRIAKEPWAREVILGLAGRFNESHARSRLEELIDLSLEVTRWRTPLNIAGWYFPVEVDPTWSNAPAMAPLLARLPRPLWISVYDSANVGARALTDWLVSWLPKDVGVFFQDGVGVHAREPKVATEYVEALAKALGRRRIKVIAEAFRPLGTAFRAATADELRPQLAAYRGYAVYVFDGPHYVSDTLINGLLD